MEPLSNRTCQLCQEHPASHFCNCRSPSTFFCEDCSPHHHAKYPSSTHHILPIKVLRHKSEESKIQALEKATAELRRNLEHMEQFFQEFDDLIQGCINYLSEYRSWWLQEVQKEKSELSNAIEEAVQEVGRCLDEGIEPESGLSRALWTLPPEELQVFSYSVTPPDLQTVCQTWTSYQITLHSLCERFSKRPVSRPEEAKHSPISNRPQEVLDIPKFFAAMHKNAVEIYDLQSQKSTKHTLKVDLLDGSYIMVNRHTLLCLGIGKTDSAVYELDLSTLKLTSLPPLVPPRGVPGVAKVANTVYVFGGWNVSVGEMKSCEKYELQGRQWLPLGSMQEGRLYFTPCIFRSLIYLLSPETTRTIETFSPETETFTVLPVYLPSQLEVPQFSVSFVANGELCVLTNRQQMGRWRIESEREFRLFATDRSCSSTQPPLIVDSLVLIANNWPACLGVELFSLESYAFISKNSLNCITF